MRGSHSGHSRYVGHIVRLLTTGVVLAVAACRSDRGGGPIAPASVALTASGTTLAVGQSVTVYVHATDASGSRIPNFGAVTWESSNATVASVVKSDTAAIITGLATGESIISASVGKLRAQMSVQVGQVPVIVTAPAVAAFTGYRGFPVASQSIAITNGGSGTLDGLSVTTSAAWLQASLAGGVTSANPTATLKVQPTVGTLSDGSYTGSVTIASSARGVASKTIPVTFQVAPVPVAFKIEAMTLPTQAGSAGQPVAQAPAVVVRAADNTPVPGVAVTFSVNGGGSIVPSGVVNTDASGIASLVSWTLSAQAGALQTVTVSAPGLAGSPLTFTATSLSASKIVRVSGDGQSTVLARPLPEPLVVRVTDPNDAPVPNATVTFVAAAGTVSPSSAVTDANGLASATWTLGASTGTQQLTVFLVGPPGSPSVIFTATATGATTLSKIAGDGQSAAAGSDLPVPVRVRVTGVNAQAVTGTTVTFTPAEGSGTTTPITAVTDANGEASARWTMPTSVGTKTLAASVVVPTGVATVTFTATATPPPIGGITIADGDNQNGRISAALPRQVVARVVTTIGTGVPGVSVTFTPATGTGQSFSPVSGTTDANGEVRTTWTLGPTLGTYTATVASPGLASRTITAAANLLPPNVGAFSGAAAKMPGATPPGAAEQPVLTYSGPVSGEVALDASGAFITPPLPLGTYTLAIVSKTGAFPTTTMYGVALPGGVITSVGTISVAYAGSGPLRIAVHACPIVGDANGTATIRLYNGINGDQGGSLAYTWTIPFSSLSQATAAYGIYTMVITTQATDPTKTCGVYRASVEHTWTTPNGTTTIPLIVLSNP